MPHEKLHTQRYYLINWTKRESGIWHTCAILIAYMHSTTLGDAEWNNWRIAQRKTQIKKRIHIIWKKEKKKKKGFIFDRVKPQIV